MTKKEFLQKRESLKAEMANLEGAAYDAKLRELQILQADYAAEQIREAPTPEKSANEWMREQLQSVVNGQTREIVFGGSSNSIENSGAINTKINQMIDTLNEGLGLPAGCQLVTGVTGNEIWPVSVNDVEMQEVGENVGLEDTGLDFDNIKATPGRAGVPIDVSNKAIDQASFDVASFVLKKIQLAKRKFLAKKIYSQAQFTGIKGPFSGLASAGTITISTGAGAYKAILKAVAQFTDKGFTGTPCLVIDAVTEADLKATPKAEGQGGFIIEGGKLAGYPYVVTHYINTTLAEDNKTLKATTDRYLGIGFFEYLAVQQHGQERLTKDATSKGVAIINKTNFTYNAEFSITDLSVKLNKKNGAVTQAFALYKLA